MENQIPISEGGKRILNTVKDELFPVINELKELLVKIQKFRVNFYVYSKELSIFESDFSKISEKFFIVSKKLKTPDILFQDLPHNPQDIASYFQFQEAFSRTLDEGMKYIEIIDRTLDRKNQNMQNSRTLILALAAVIISLLSLK